MDIPRPFIRLPFAFDARRLSDEALALRDDAWMAHPSRLKGNSAVPLISRDAGDNDFFDGRMCPTQHLKRCPYTAQVMAGFGEVLGRSRFMRLAAGAEVATHVDFNYHWYSRVRIHIPVITHPGVTFFCADEQVHMQAGECWIFNSWRRHRVTNDSDLDRVHLVIDLAGSSRFWRTVREVQSLHPVNDREKIDARTTALEYVPGQHPLIATEQFNIAPVMSPGELDGLISTLVADFERHPGNNPALVQRYRQLLADFASDWRETWLLHGYQKSGWPVYRQLVDGVYSQLHPDRRALITSTNQVGVNPIIVQRILKAALASEHFDAFLAPRA